jgi:hypothetical protein
MDKIDDSKKIELESEDIIILDDRYFISLRSNDNSLNLKTIPKRHKTSSVACVIMWLISIVFIVVRMNVNNIQFIPYGILIYLFCYSSIVTVYYVFYISGKTILYKKDITRIYIGRTRRFLIFKFKYKGIAKARYVGLPLDINGKSKVLQTLYENNLINRKSISQIIK